MTDSLLQRYVRPLPKSAEASKASEPSTEIEQEDNYGAFGWLPGVRDRVLMLELRRKNGLCRAFGNAWLSEANFDPSEGITLKISGQIIRIFGRNLNAEIRPNVRLFNGLLRHKVPFIQEADEQILMRSKDRDVVVEQIEW